LVQKQVCSLRSDLRLLRVEGGHADARELLDVSQLQVGNLWGCHFEHLGSLQVTHEVLLVLKVGLVYYRHGLREVLVFELLHSLRIESPSLLLFVVSALLLNLLQRNVRPENVDLRSFVIERVERASRNELLEGHFGVVVDASYFDGFVEVDASRFQLSFLLQLN